MSFGGYKFSGYRVDNTTYSTSIERCLAIHAARIRAFLNASSAAGSPWVADSAWLTGTLGFDASTGTITSGVNNGVIHVLLGEDGNPHGYSSYFKYSQDDVNGYYFIMTVDNYNVDYGSSGANGVSLNQDTMPLQYSNSRWVIYSQNGSCFHCFSKDPFGHAPTGQEGKDYRYLNTDGQGATRLKSIGFNTSNYISNLPGNITSGYVNNSTFITMFGYAIKDKDIIMLCSSADASSYTNPFSSDINTHVSVLSLDGFSELYAKDDIYRLLQLEIKNGYYMYSGAVNEEWSCNQMLGSWSSTLDVNGVSKSGTRVSGTTTWFSSPSLFFDLRSIYNPSGASYTTLAGISLYCSWVSDFQKAKGCTNPELVSIGATTSQTSNPIFSTQADGSIIFIGRMSGNFPRIIDNSSGFDTSSTFYFNLFVGWDPSNPDIKTDAAWPEYNAVIPVS